MKLSKYCKIYTDTLPSTLFNTLTRYEVAVENELYAALKERELHKFNAELVDDLSELGILVSDECDETSLLLSFIQRETTQTEELDITFAITSRCNMACSYCVQDGWESEESCPDDAFIWWICALLDKRKPNKLNLSFFGGEPLLKTKSITVISLALTIYCNAINVDFGFNITTNGTLLNAADIKLWKSYGLRCVNVTIDGMQESHDDRRKYKNGDGTFNNIIHNLKTIDGLIPVNLICNISSQDESFSDFLHFIKERSEVKFNEIRFKPFFPGGGKNVCFYDSNHTEILKRIWREAEALSLPVDRNVILGPCGFFKQNSLVVAPDGKIYPCTPFMGNSDFQIGSVETTSNIEKKRDLLNNLPDKCVSCSYSPICCGGCRFVSLQRQGNIAAATCEKNFFNSIFDSL